MKILKLISILILLVANLSWANSVKSVFKETSEVPIQWRQLLLSTLTEMCPSGISPYGLKEENSKLIRKTEDPVSKSIVQEFQIFIDSTYYFDGYHPSHQGLIVRFSVTQDSEGSIIESDVKLEKGLCKSNY